MILELQRLVDEEDGVSVDNGMADASMNGMSAPAAQNYGMAMNHNPYGSGMANPYSNGVNGNAYSAPYTNGDSSMSYR
jgi:hypothetical protein